MAAAAVGMVMRPVVMASVIVDVSLAAGTAMQMDVIGHGSGSGDGVLPH